MTREEAIKEIKMWGIEAPRQREVLETLIPELRESEDEIMIKVAKEIILEHRSHCVQSGIEPSRHNRVLAWLEKQKVKDDHDRMMPIYNNRDSFESALEKAWKSYNDSGARAVDGCEDDYVECAHAKGFREGFLYGVEKQKDAITDVTMTEAYKMGLEAGRAQEAAENFFDSAQSYHDGFVAGQKQKENPKSADSISADCTSDAKCEDRWHKVTDSLPDNGRLVLAQDCLGNTLLARYDGEGNWEVSVYDNDDYYCRNTITNWCEIPSEKQKEQKPEVEICPHSIKSKSYKETGYPIENCDYGLEIALQILTKTLGKVTGYQSDDGIREHQTAIQAVKEAMKEQKPWKVGANAYFTPEPKPALSEEDKEAIDKNLLTAAIAFVDLNPYNYWCGIDKRKVIKALRSLKPQWKPSEEQMNALNALNCHGDLSYVGQQNQLISLYNDLKKLKGGVAPMRDIDE